MKKTRTLLYTAALLGAAGSFYFFPREIGITNNSSYAGKKSNLETKAKPLPLRTKRISKEVLSKKDIAPSKEKTPIIFYQELADALGTHDYESFLEKLQQLKTPYLDPDNPWNNEEQPSSEAIESYLNGDFLESVKLNISAGNLFDAAIFALASGLPEEIVKSLYEKRKELYTEDKRAVEPYSPENITLLKENLFLNYLNFGLGGAKRGKDFKLPQEYRDRLKEIINDSQSTRLSCLERLARQVHLSSSEVKDAVTRRLQTASNAFNSYPDIFNLEDLAAGYRLNQRGEEAKSLIEKNFANAFDATFQQAFQEHGKRDIYFDIRKSMESLKPYVDGESFNKADHILESLKK